MEAAISHKLDGSEGYLMLIKFYVLLLFFAF